MPPQQNRDYTEEPARLEDVAEAAGVSIHAVSRILSGKTKGKWSSSAENIKRIKALAHEMNYTPNRAAQVMRARQTRQIGVVVKDMSTPATGRVMEVVGRELQRRGYGALMVSMEGTHKEMMETLGEFSKNLMDGLINFHPGLDAKNLADFRLRVPSITYNRSPDFSPVMLDVRGGIMMAMQHLWDLGHRRIGIMTALENLEQTTAKIGGMQAFYTKQSATFPKDWVFYVDADEKLPAKAVEAGMNSHVDWVYHLAEALIDRFLASGCTACITGGDVLGAGFCSELLHRGYDIPRDYSIVSMDDTFVAHFSRPHLTTLQPPLAELIKLTVDALLARVENRPPPDFTTLKPKLIVRESTGPCPESG